MTAAAVLFDMDGLLIDSEPIWFAAESNLVSRLGGTWTPADQAACMGGTLASGASYIATLTKTDRSVDWIVDALLDEMTRHFAGGVPMRPGALDLLDAVRSAGIKTALVTSTYRRLLDAALVPIGAHRFDITVAGDEVSAGKPDPAPYLLACTRLDVEPQSCVVLEDALTGATSAWAAGCAVVVVQSEPETAPVPPDAGWQLRDSLTEIAVDWLLALPGASTGDIHHVRST